MDISDPYYDPTYDPTYDYSVEVSERNGSTTFDGLEQVDGSIFGFGVFGFHPPECFTSFLNEQATCDLSSQTWKTVLNATCKSKTIDLLSEHVHMNPGHFSIGEVVGYFILFFIGLVGNLLVIFTLAGNSDTLKRSANVYILNLTISDLLLIISIPNTIFVPQFKSLNQQVDKVALTICDVNVEIPLFGLPNGQITTDFWEESGFNEHICNVTDEDVDDINGLLKSHYRHMTTFGQWKKFMYTVNFISFFASVAFLTLMSVDRFLLIVGNNPRFREKCLTYSNYICIAAWLFAVCMSTPLFIWYQVNHKTGELDSGLSQFVMMEEVDGSFTWDHVPTQNWSESEWCTNHAKLSTNSFLMIPQFREKCEDYFIEHLLHEHCKEKTAADVDCANFQNRHMDSSFSDLYPDLSDSSYGSSFNFDSVYSDPIFDFDQYIWLKSYVEEAVQNSGRKSYASEMEYGDGTEYFVASGDGLPPVFNYEHDGSQLPKFPSDTIVEHHAENFGGFFSDKISDRKHDPPWCFYCVKAYNAYLICIMVICFFLPLILMIISYTLIFMKLHESTKRLKLARNTETKTRLDARKRVIIMIFVILASFVVCWCPFHIEKLIEIADTAQDIDEAAFINGDITGVTQNDPCNDLTNSTDYLLPDDSLPLYNNRFTFKGVASFLVFLNAAINPFIYTFLSSKFKENLLNAVTCCQKVNQDIQRRSITTLRERLPPSNRMSRKFSTDEYSG